MYRISTPFSMLRRLLALAGAVLLLSGCDQIAALMADPRVAQREEEARAIGGACRHALRGIEDCYTLNPKAAKAAVFAGWKDMDAYMRENKVEGVPSVLGRSDRPARSSNGAGAADAVEADTVSELGRRRPMPMV